MRTVDFSVPDAHCGACRASIRTVLEGIAGVRGVVVDLTRRVATVSFEPTRTSVGHLARALAQAGYPARVVGPSTHPSDPGLGC